MSYHQAHAQNGILTGLYPDTVRTFVMERASIFNVHFTAVPFNAPNKPGALVAADFLLSVDAQASKNDPRNWGDFTVLDLDRLNPAQRARFDRIDLGEATLDLETLAAHAVPEIPAGYLEALESGWEEHVLRK
jgi:putative spermidine/putrescine transport system substrate-binding protein